MSVEQYKVGLVLTGGGAKGAYHVGAMQAIAEIDIPVHGVAGASIGALNGAIVSTSDSVQQASEVMKEIWLELASSETVAFSKKIPAYITMMLGMGAAFNAMPVLSSTIAAGGRIAEEFGFGSSTSDVGLLDDSPLVKLLNQYISADAIKKGLPMFVSVYESDSALRDILGVLRSSLRLGNTRESDFLHLQSLNDSEIQQALMASAALPLLFQSRQIQGKYYTDGGQGDWYGVGGNTPVKPLVYAGYKTLIVVHLCDGSSWDRNLYPNTNIIEVRPRSEISSGNNAKDLLGFDPSRINSLIDQGYEDSLYILKRVFNTIDNHKNLEKSKEILEFSVAKHEAMDRKLERAMSRIKELS